MPKVLLDPYLLMFPSDCRSSAEISKFCEQLVLWEDVINSENFVVTMPPDMVEALLDDGAFPFDNELRQTVRSFQASEQFPVDLASEIITALIERHETTSSLFCYFELVEAKEIVIEPSEIVNRLGPHTSLCWEEGLVRQALFKKVDTAAFGSTILGTTEISSASLSVSALIVAAEPNPSISLEFFVAEELSVCVDPDQLLSDLGLNTTRKFDDVHGVVEHCIITCKDGLIFLESAIASAKDSPYSDTQRLLATLTGINDVALKRMEAVKEGISIPLERYFAALGIDYASKQNPLTKNTFKDEYFVEYEGYKYCLDPHVRLGSSLFPERCLRIHFFIDRKTNKFVIEHVGRHKRNISEKR